MARGAVLVRVRARPAFAASLRPAGQLEYVFVVVLLLLCCSTGWTPCKVSQLSDQSLDRCIHDEPRWMLRAVALGPFVDVSGCELGVDLLDMQALLRLSNPILPGLIAMVHL
jgi:hypothetical protein